jgi:uncharacterized repeat protein (TIGR01451 family)
VTLNVFATEGEELLSQPTVSQAGASLRTLLASPKVLLRQVTTPSACGVGDTVPLLMEVANQGNGTATGVILQVTLPAGLHHPAGNRIERDIGTLAPGQSREVTLEVNAASRGKHTYQATALAEDDHKAAFAASVDVGEATLTLTQTGPAQRFANTETAFILQLQNTGDGPAREVQLLDTLPEAMTFLSATDDGAYDQASHCVVWRFGELRPGEARRIVLKAMPTVAGEHFNRAVLRAAPNLKARADAKVTVDGVPALQLHLVDREDPLAVGDETTYEIRVRNQGSARSTRIQVLAVVPEGLSILQASADVGHRVQGRQVIFEPALELSARAAAVYHVRVRAESPGTYRFRAQLQSDQLRLPVCAEESTRVLQD